MIYYTSSLFTCCQSYEPINYLTLSAIHVDSSKHHTISNIHLNTDEGRLGIDSHADMSCAGKHARIVGIEEGQTSTVYPFDDSMKPTKEVKTVHVAYAYDAPNGQTTILQINHYLDFTNTMEHSIICTNQARANNVIVNDCPKIFDQTNVSTQSIIFPNSSNEIPINFHGPVPYIPIRYPTDNDLDGSCPTVHLTAEEGWNMDLIPLSHKVSSISTQDSILDTYLMQNDLLERLHETVQLSGVAHKSEKSIRPETLASM